MKVREIQTIETCADLEHLVNELGFLPYFTNHIPGFSVEEHCAPAYFTDDIDGPWEWKGPVIRHTGCVYGKYFRKKAGFISKDWFYDFMNYRRDGYDFDARFNDQLATHKQKQIFEILDRQDSMLSIVLREESGYSKGQCETLITQLFMLGYITTSDFVYRTTRSGQSYGWGIARYATIERYYGDAYIQRAYKRTPEESLQRILDHLKTICEDASEADLMKLIGA